MRSRRWFLGLALSLAAACLGFLTWFWNWKSRKVLEEVRLDDLRKLAFLILQFRHDREVFPSRLEDLIREGYLYPKDERVGALSRSPDLLYTQPDADDLGKVDRELLEYTGEGLHLIARMDGRVRPRRQEEPGP